MMTTAGRHATDHTHFPNLMLSLYELDEKTPSASERPFDSIKYLHNLERTYVCVCAREGMYEEFIC